MVNHGYTKIGQIEGIQIMQYYSQIKKQNSHQLTAFLLYFEFPVAKGSSCNAFQKCTLFRRTIYSLIY